MKFTLSLTRPRPGPMVPHSDQYQRYLASDAWKVKRGQVLLRSSFKCEHCGVKDVPLQIHHRHYRTLGKERLADLAALCSECHAVADTLRQQWSKK